MALTGLPLLVLAIAAMIGVLAGTVLLWNRGRRLKYATRAGGVLLAEALLLLSAGLAVNRSEEFYPTWDSLTSSGEPAAPEYKTVAGDLDSKLAHTAAPSLFPWQPEGLASWKLAAPPSVVIPAGYLDHPEWRYSVVLVVANEGKGWPGGSALAIAAQAPHDIVVFVATAPGFSAQVLADSVPAALGRDLRVTAHRWALVATAADEGLAQSAMLAAPGQFPALAVVHPAPTPPHPGASSQSPHPGGSPVSPRPGGSPASPHPGGSPASPRPGGSPSGPRPGVASAHPRPGVSVKPGRPRALVSLSGPVSSGGPGVGRTESIGILPEGMATFAVAGTGSAQNGFAKGVAWAGEQTPPPLANSAPPVTRLPVYRPSPGPSKIPHKAHGNGRGPHGAGRARY